METTCVHQLLEMSAARFPEKEAVVYGEQRFQYSVLNALTNKAARWLVRQSVNTGDRVVIFLENSLEYIVSYYAILKVGAVAVPMNSDLPTEGIRPLLETIEPKVIITRNRFLKQILPTAPATFGVEYLVIVDQHERTSAESLRIFPWSEIDSEMQSDNLALEINPEDVASIILTSGSTGKPKGVMLTHRNILANVRSIVEYLELTADDVQMVVLPFFYVMGKSLLNTHIAVGGKVVINNRFAFPAQVVQQMIDEKVTGFSGVPSTYAYLLHRSPFKASRDKLQALRYCSQAGGHMASSLKHELLEVLPEKTRLFIMYGATEASARLSYVEPERLRDKMDSIGRPIPGVSMKVLDENGLERPVGEVGEIVASGANIMKGYWRDPQSTAKALTQQGYHTGDLGYRDEDGYFFAVGRKDSLLKVGGHRINPLEIEDTLLASRLLIEVAVLGIPDAFLGHKLVALAVPSNKALTQNDLLGQCIARLPRHKLPEPIHFVPTIPKHASGKVDREKCLAMFYQINGGNGR